jgi:tetrapyrrole methylase family protein/MazG family protein
VAEAPKHLRDFTSLVAVVKSLRDPVGGCPWDIEQTHETLTPHMLEEAHELVEAIESGNRTHMVEELGDVLLQVVLHSEIGRQSGEFDISDIIENLNKKLIYRHPHVFSEMKAASAKEALENWEQMKAAEKKEKVKKDQFEIPPNLPALQRAQKIGAKTKKFNFDWNNVGDVMDKVDEEVRELKEAIAAKDRIGEELGDLLFTVAQAARHLGIEPEGALRDANRKFETRFFKMKSLAESRGLELEKTPNTELEKIWQEIKKI